MLKNEKYKASRLLKNNVGYIGQTLLLAYTMSHKLRSAVPNPNAMPFTAATRTFGKLINSSTNSL